MADETPPTTPPAETPAPTTTPPAGDTGGAAAPEPDGTGGDDVDAIGTEAEIDGPPINPSNINTRETADAYSQTIPLDLATVDEIADHVADTFGVEVRRFMNTHPGVRHMLTIAVHAQGEIVHAFDVKADMALARDTRTEGDRLEQYLRNRFSDEITGGGSAVDVVIRLLEKLRPLSAAEAGLAAATRR